MRLRFHPRPWDLPVLRCGQTPSPTTYTETPQRGALLPVGDGAKARGDGLAPHVSSCLHCVLRGSLCCFRQQERPVEPSPPSRTPCAVPQSLCRSETLGEARPAPREQGGGAGGGWGQGQGLPGRRPGASRGTGERPEPPHRGVRPDDGFFKAHF